MNGRFPAPAMARLVPGTFFRPRLTNYRFALAVTHYDLGNLLLADNQLAEAGQSLQQAVRLLAELVGQAPGDSDCQRKLTASHGSLGGLLERTGRIDEAEKAYLHGLEVAETWAKNSPRIQSYRNDVAGIHNRRAALLMRAGRSAEAEAAFRQSLAVRQGLADDFPDVPDCQSQLAASMHNLAYILAQAGNLTEADQLVREAIRLQQAALKMDPDHPVYRRFLLNHYRILSNILLDQKDHAQAAVVAAKAAELLPDSGEDSYRAARIVARCLQVVQAARLDPERKQSDLVRTYTRQALAFLRAGAEAKALPDPDSLELDSAFAALRSNEDFRRLLSTLPKK